MIGPASADEHQRSCKHRFPMSGNASQRSLVKPTHTRAAVGMRVPVTQIDRLPRRHFEDLIESATLPVMVRVESLPFVLSAQTRTDNVLDDEITVVGGVSHEHPAGFERIDAPSLIQHFVESRRSDPQLAHACALQSGQSCLAARS
jgi:hypothetical protein